MGGEERMRDGGIFSDPLQNLVSGIRLCLVKLNKFLKTKNMGGFLTKRPCISLAYRQR